ncbi:SDR family oxidoreductase [Streptomyces shenzhenensis]|uniref:SDR family oxidoreductase n=1 Tax=Streptomyces shenzhenensis TaxID=943815 RepID=UPI003D89BB55
MTAHGRGEQALLSPLNEHGHEAVAAAPNTLTGEGLAEVLKGASVVIDVSNSPSFEDEAVMDFFRTSTTNLMKAESEAGVAHHVALSVVGTERLQDSGYFRAKQAQEELIKASGIPYSIVHATQFFEFMKAIAAAATEGDTVRLAPVKIQPVASDDVAATVGRTAVGDPVNGVVEVAGPDAFQLDQLIGKGLAAEKDPRTVVADVHAPYIGAELKESTLLPAPGAHIGGTRFTDWLSRQQ